MNAFVLSPHRGFSLSEHRFVYRDMESRVGAKSSESKEQKSELEKIKETYLKKMDDVHEKSSKTLRKAEEELRSFYKKLQDNQVTNQPAAASRLAYLGRMVYDFRVKIELVEQMREQFEEEWGDPLRNVKNKNGESEVHLSRNLQKKLSELDHWHDLLRNN